MALRSSSHQYTHGSTWTVPVPVGAAIDDIVIIAVSSDGTDYPTLPSGFTALGQANPTTDGQFCIWGWKRLTAADAGSYSGSLVRNTYGCAVALCFSGRDTANPPVSASPSTFGSATGNGFGIYVTHPGITAVAGDDVVFVGFPDTTSSNQPTGCAASSPTMFTQGPSVLDADGATWTSIGTLYAENAPAGATGSVSYDFNYSGQMDWSSVTLRIPSAVAPTPPNAGSATGSLTFSGSATGHAPAVAPNSGTASGSLAWSGSASGSASYRGSGSGSLSWSGSANGHAVAMVPNVGYATGTLDWAGTANGSMKPSGSASGALSWTGGATGHETPHGSATGALAFSGSAAGSHVAQGSASGSLTFTGSATGHSPTVGVSSGSATGSVAWTGTANGSFKASGRASAGLSWSGSATGHTPVVGASSGASSGSLLWAGSAQGSTVHKGTTHGAFTWSGIATGHSPSIAGASGSTTGSILWTGTAQGSTRHKGTANAALSWSGTAAGTVTHLGTATDSLSWSGRAHGLMGALEAGTPVSDPVLTLAHPRADIALKAINAALTITRTDSGVDLTQVDAVLSVDNPRSDLEVNA